MNAVPPNDSRLGAPRADRDRDALDAALLDAHRRGDPAALIGLYTQAAERCIAQGGAVAANFYLTHAYVFALEHGDSRARALRARLVARGCEDHEPQGSPI